MFVHQTPTAVTAGETTPSKLPFFYLCGVLAFPSTLKDQSTQQS
jgi:hypothetical protein